MPVSVFQGSVCSGGEDGGEVAAAEVTKSAGPKLWEEKGVWNEVTEMEGLERTLEFCAREALCIESSAEHSKGA